MGAKERERMEQNNDETVARAGLTRIIEPNDQTGAALVAILGAVEAYALIREHKVLHPPGSSNR